jgi:hypothetical protein
MIFNIPVGFSGARNEHGSIYRGQVQSKLQGQNDTSTLAGLTLYNVPMKEVPMMTQEEA